LNVISTNLISLLYTTATVLDTTLKYCKAFSRGIGQPFREGETIRLTAFTGAAATEIGGNTAHTAFGLFGKDTARPDEITAFENTRLNIVDEVSFASYSKGNVKMSNRLKSLTNSRDGAPFGKIPLVFLGDFRQIEAVNGDSAYKTPGSLCFESAITHFIELKGTHRFKNCNVLKTILPALRNEGLPDQGRPSVVANRRGTDKEIQYDESKDFLKMLNKRVIGKSGCEMPDISKVQFATFFNATRNGINNYIFYEYLKKYHSTSHFDTPPDTAVVVKCDASYFPSKIPLNFAERKHLFEGVCEGQISASGGKHCDPLLRLFQGCSVMCTENADVSNGVANGTTAIFEKLMLKPGIEKQKVKLHGYWVYCVDARDVDSVKLRWHNCKFEGTFHIKPTNKQYTVTDFFRTKRRDNSEKRFHPKLKIFQVPIVLNHATTGHKLQGKSLDSLVIHEWSDVTNWAYVLLSRVRTIDGLYLCSEIPDSIDFNPKAEYLGMMDRLQCEEKVCDVNTTQLLHEDAIDELPLISRN